jgi:hypothetical protein
MTHPYSGLPASNFWRKLVTDTSWRDLNLNDPVKFELKPSDKIATAGSCFAQHISRYMNKVGLTIFNSEPAHPLMHNFGTDLEGYNQFSARYGNVYTSRQCLELLLQSMGRISVIEDFVEDDGRWFDLMRPGIQKTGFSSLREARADRLYHISRVKEMFLQADVFIFTLGLTECWFHGELGFTYPACPGTVKGNFNPELHLFRNLNYSQIMEDMEQLIGNLLEINPTLRIILTVSPIPLVATRTSQNVLLASTYSKSVLRSVVGDLQARYGHVAYFPSYEIISHVCSFGQYLASDLREVTERGVSHVMNCFLGTYFQPFRLSSVESLQSPQSTHTNYTPPPPVECEEVFNFA